MRKTYVYASDPITGELTCYEKGTEPQKYHSPMVIGDIAGYTSMKTGEWIGGRAQHREHLRRHDLIEIGNELKAHAALGQNKSSDTERRREAIARAIQAHGL
tara:strand:+ start:3197 stop:3502 length:306 start_codon:yes stop_codon:yes gene_type:complete